MKRVLALLLACIMVFAPIASFANEEENYTYSSVNLELGSNEYELDGSYEYTLFWFEPTEMGKYTVSSSDSKIVLAGYNWLNFPLSPETVNSESFEWNCTGVGQSILVAVGAEGATANITVELSGSISTGPEKIEYVNVVTPEAFNIGSVTGFVSVDIEDQVVDSAVLGEDGYYHLNDENGAVLYANLNDTLMSLYGAYSYGQLKAAFYNDGVAVKVVDYNNAFNEYYSAITGSAKYYPLTEDLIKMFQNVGEDKGWYGSTGMVGGTLEDCWMFACYYDPNYVPAEPGPALGDSENPYLLNVGDTRVVAYIEPGETAWVKVDDSNGSVLNIGYATTADYQVYYCKQQYLPEGEDNAFTMTLVDGADMFSIYNASETEAVTVYMALTGGTPVDTTGTMDNPEVVTAGDQSVELEAGNQGYYYSWTAAEDGTVVVTMSDDNAAGWTYCVNIEKADGSYVYGDNHWSDDDPLVAYEENSVAAGDVVKVFVSTYDPANEFAAPAGAVNWNLTFETAEVEIPLGNYENPYLLNLGDTRVVAYIEPGMDAWVKVDNSNGSVLNIGYATTADYQVYYCRQQYLPEGEDNALSVTMVDGADMFSIYNASETEAVNVYMVLEAGTPVDTTGTMDNPKVVEVGEQSIELAAGSLGYYYSWTAEEDGTVVVTMSDDNAAGWMYNVNIEKANGSYKYGDNHWSNDDPVVSYESYDVEAGDVVKVFVITYDPRNVFNAPEGAVNWGLSFTPAPALGDYENPYLLNVGDTRVVAYIEPGMDAWVKVDDSNGSVLNIGYATTADYQVYYCRQQYLPEGEDNALTMTLVDGADMFSIYNASETEAVTVYMALTGGTPVDTTGTMDNPEVVTAGDQSVELEAGNQGYYYSWTAAEDGTVVVTMSDDNAAGWTYCVNIEKADGSYVYGDTHWSDDDPLVAYEENSVAAGDVVKVFVTTYDPANMFVAPAGTVNWALSFTAGEGDSGDEGGSGDEGDDDPIIPEYRELGDGESYLELELGTSDYATDPEYKYTIYSFEPTDIGKYTISVADGVVGIVSYSGMWVAIEPTEETVNTSSVEWNCIGVGQSIWVAVNVDADIASITVEREDIVINEPEKISYENQVVPESFAYIGNPDDLEYVETFDDILDEAVLGDDGYYHLNSADGPILYVDLNDDMMDLSAAMSYGQLKYVVYENDIAVKVINYNDAFAEYLACADANSKLYPLTVDLIEIYKYVGTNNGWYGENGFIGGEIEDCWMFACYYNPKGDEPVNPFSDVKPGQWYSEAILYCYYNTYMTGTGENADGTMVFSYKANMDRQMFATILAKIAGADTSSYTEMSFSDVKAGQWYSNAIEWAYRNGYAAGTGVDASGKPSFGRKDLVTRETLAQFLYTYSSMNGVDVTEGADLSAYTDLDRVHGWALEAVKWAVKAGLISGTTETTLAPRNTATRAEVSVIIMNYVESVLKTVEEDTSVRPGTNPDVTPDEVPAE